MSSLEQIGLFCCYSLERLRRTGRSDGAIITVQTTVMTHLEEEGAVTKRRAAFDALTTTDAQRFVNDIFVIGMFHKTALDRSGWAKLIFSAGVEGVWLRIEIAGAKLAVPAHGELMNAFDRRVLQHTMSRALSALYALVGVQLPDDVIRLTAGDQYARGAAQSQQTHAAYGTPDKISSGYSIFLFRHTHHQAISSLVSRASGCLHLLRNVQLRQMLRSTDFSSAEAICLLVTKTPDVETNPPRIR